MTFDRHSLATDYLAINRMLHELKLKKWNYDKGTGMREAIDDTIRSLERLKSAMGIQIDKDACKSRI
jgi:hypothetical protein